MYHLKPTLARYVFNTVQPHTLNTWPIWYSHIWEIYNCYVFVHSGIFYHTGYFFFFIPWLESVAAFGHCAWTQDGILETKHFKFLKLHCSEYKILMILCITVVDYSITLSQKELKNASIQLKVVGFVFHNINVFCILSLLKKKCGRKCSTVLKNLRNFNKKKVIKRFLYSCLLLPPGEGL